MHLYYRRSLTCINSDDIVSLGDLAPPQVHDIVRHLPVRDGSLLNLGAILAQARFTAAQPHRIVLLLTWPTHLVHHRRMT